MLDPDFKAKWIAALRDPANRQCVGRLGEMVYDAEKKEHVEANCCVGLAARLAGATRAVYQDLVYYDGQCLVSCTPSLEQMGLHPEHQKQLAAMNDGVRGRRRHSFAEIADYIEKNF